MSVCLSSTPHRLPLDPMTVFATRHRRLLHFVLFQHVVQSHGSGDGKSNALRISEPFSYLLVITLLSGYCDKSLKILQF